MHTILLQSTRFYQPLFMALLPLLFSFSILYPEFAAPLKIDFPFVNEAIDVVIPCTKKDLATLELCIAGIKENCHEIRRIIVVSKEPLTSNAEWYDENLYPFSMHEVACELLGSTIGGTKYVANRINRLGWIYQQLLKLYAQRIIPGISSNVLILDSDTIFLNPITFIVETGAALFDISCEYHLPDFAHAERLLPYLHRVFPSFSGICNHMLMQKCVVDDLHQAVETRHNLPFWRAFLRCVKKSELFGSGASEYEIYFNYAHIRSDQFKIRELRSRNISKLSEIAHFKSCGYHYVCAHAYLR